MDSNRRLDTLNEDNKIITSEDVIDFINSGKLNNKIEEENNSFLSDTIKDKNIETKYIEGSKLTKKEQELLMSEFNEKVEKEKEEEEGEEEKEETTKENKRIQLSPENTEIFGRLGIKDNYSNIEITESDKEIFFRSTLEDSSFILPVTFFNGKLIYHIKSLSLGESELVKVYIAHKLNEISKKAKEQHVTDYRLYLLNGTVNDLLQEATVSLGLVAIQGQRLWENAIDKDLSIIAFDEAVKIIDARRNVLKTFPVHKWMNCLNAFKVFEYKQAKLSEFLINEDFWKPLNIEES